MNKKVLENPVEVRTAVPAPHFVDQRVVWRAQRVVPLNEIRTRLRLRKLLYLGSAFAIAIMLGAASALVAVHLKRASQVQVTNNTVSEVEITAPEPIAESVSIEPASVEKVPAEPKKQAPIAERPRVVAKQNVPLTPERRGVEPSEEEQLEQIRESVLYEQWQERRQRRAERRARRNRGDRDLSRVDEIFEGPRRRERPY